MSFSNLIFAVMVLAPSTLFAHPLVGTKVTYNFVNKEREGSGTGKGQDVVTVISHNAAKQTLRVLRTKYIDGIGKVVEFYDEVNASPSLPSEYAGYMKNSKKCEGSPVEIKVPAGTFSACKHTGGTRRFATQYWWGGVPFGEIKSISTLQMPDGTNSTTYRELVSVVRGK
jgi:hypothetical protein